MALLSTWALVVTRFIEPVTHRSHLDRCAQPHLDLSGSSQSNHLPSTPPLAGVLQLRSVLPHTLRSTGVLDGVAVPAATRSRRFGLKWRVAVALSSAIAAFLHVGRCVMCLRHALHGMQAPSDSFRRQLETRVTLETGIYHVFQAPSGRRSTSIVAHGRSACSLMFGTMQGVQRLRVLPRRLHTTSIHLYAHLAIPLETGSSTLTLGNVCTVSRQIR